MEIRICFSKRFIWNARRLGRWAYRIVPGMMELFGLALVIVGGVVIWGEAGNYECGAAVHESAVVAAVLSVAIGGSFLWAVHEIDEIAKERCEARKEKRCRQQKRMKRP